MHAYNISFLFFSPFVYAFLVSLEMRQNVEEKEEILIRIMFQHTLLKKKKNKLIRNHEKKQIPEAIELTCISCARGENNAVFWANDEKEIRKYNGNCYKLAANLWDLWNNKRQTLRLNVYRFFSILLWRNGEKKKTEDFIDVKFYCEGNFSVKIYEFSKLNFLCLCDAE